MAGDSFQSEMAQMVEQETSRLILAHDAWSEFWSLLLELEPQARGRLIAVAVRDLVKAKGLPAQQKAEPAAIPISREPKPAKVDDGTGRPPWGELPKLIKAAIEATTGDFTLPQILAVIRQQYPRQQRGQLHKYFYEFEREGFIEVVTPGVQGNTGKPTIWRKAQPKEPVMEPLQEKAASA